MSLLSLIGAGLGVIAMFAPVGMAIGKVVLMRFGRIAIVDRRDEARFL